jgi:hypothetical protein
MKFIYFFNFMSINFTKKESIINSLKEANSNIPDSVFMK